MLKEDSIVVGAYEAWAPLEQATILLKNEGFKNKDIEYSGSAPVASGEVTDEGPEERSIAGAIVGITLGVAIAWTAGIFLVRFASSTVLIATVPILIIIVASVVGEFLGTLSDAVSRSQFERVPAKGIRTLVSGGKVLLSVHCDTLSHVKKIKDILKATGAKNISLNENLIFAAN